MVKALVSIGLIAFLLVNVGWSEVVLQVKEVSKPLLVLALGIVALQFPLSTWKWHLSLQQHQLVYGFAYLQAVICIGYFLNNFLPTGVGGDAYRVIRTIPDIPPKSRAVSAVLLDRAIGLLALLSLGYGSAVYLWLIDGSNTLIDLIVPAGAFAIALLALALIAGLRTGLLKKVEDIPKIGAKLQPIINNLRLIARSTSNLNLLIVASMVFQISAVVILMILLDAASSTVSFAHCAIIVAFGGLVVMLPISIAGIGVYESAIAGAAVALGLDYQPAILAAILLRLLTIPASLVCGLVFLFSDLRSADSVHLNRS